MRFTVIGANGFIGSELCSLLEKKGISVDRVTRETPLSSKSDLGVVVYCAGYGDCTTNPSKVLDSNTNLLKDIINHNTYERLIYISSTRVYLGSEVSDETSDLQVLYSDERKLFNLTKLCAEDICFKSAKDNVVLRVSNVYGNAIKSPLFLPSIIRDSVNKGVVNMYITPNYSKDYIFVGDLVKAIYEISIKKNLKYNLYNIASGRNTKASDIAEVIQSNTKSVINWHDVNTEDTFPVTKIDRIESEMNWNPRNVLNDIKEMINLFSKAKSNE